MGKTALSADPQPIRIVGNTAAPEMAAAWDMNFRRACECEGISIGIDMKYERLIRPDKNIAVWRLLLS